MNNENGQAEIASMQSATESLSKALARLEGALAASDQAEKIAALEAEVKQVREQCALLIKENSALSAAAEKAEIEQASIELRHGAVAVQLDNAINQLQDVLSVN